MRKTFVVTTLLFVFGLFFIVCNVSAALVEQGPGYDIGSWSQAFNESGVGPFNEMEAFMVSGSTFEADGFVNFSSGGWSGALLRPDYIKAVGSALDYLQFDIKFVTAQITPLVFDFLAWNDGELQEQVRATWSGGGWSFGTTPVVSSGYDRSAAVPIPPTVWLLGSGLLGLVGLRRKFRK